MVKIKKRRLPLIALGLLVVVILIVSSWAYWTQVLEANNEYATGIYQTKLVEDFVSPEDWEPGAETNKDVLVRNEGTVPVYVKAVINQQWIRTGNVTDGNGNIIPPAEGEAFGLSFETDSGLKYAALVKWGEDVVLLKSGATSERSLSLGLPTVDTAADAQGKWILLSETPDEDGNYTFYYIGVVEAEDDTPLLVDSVTMNPEIKAAITKKEYYYDEDTGAWECIYTTNSTYDYQQAKYTMGITAYTVQATESAIDEVFAAENGEYEIINELKFQGISGYNSEFENKLCFREVDGVMEYTTGKDGDSMFMQFRDMLPGEDYTENLIITNESNKKFDLYMQVTPLEQNVLLDELLEFIEMDVYHNGQLIYSGTAMGKDYSSGCLHDVVLLGSYGAGASSEINVELKLSKDTPIKHCDLLTKIDWQFMVTEDGDPTSDPSSPGSSVTVTPVTPKTGDNFNLFPYLLIIIASTLAIHFMIRKRKKTQN